jgi:hypothetical protein
LETDRNAIRVLDNSAAGPRKHRKAAEVRGGPHRLVGQNIRLRFGRGQTETQDNSADEIGAVAQPAFQTGAKTRAVEL